jgi:ketosteroid isomerase-like protein
MKFNTPVEAEAAFYKAIEQADVIAMMSVWAEDEEVICVHPGGRRLLGADAVRESWRQIFASGPRMRFSLQQVRAHAGRLVSIRNLYERITVGTDPRQHLVLATNVYILGASGWRMLMHHASPLPADTVVPETPVGTIH